MRLVDGSTIDDGRVEVCINQAWGSICSSGWNSQDVFVVCKQLGYVIKIMEIYIYQISSYIGGEVKSISSGAGPILMSHLYCNGNEASLLDCSHQSCYVSSCSSPDAGATCESIYYEKVMNISILYLGPCKNGTIRLDIDANYPGLPGIVEVCMNNTWNTICNNHWTKTEASVTCSQLGYSPYG